MTNKELKLIAGEIIKKSDYSNSAKKQLFNFVLNEASEPEIKALILDGKIERLAEDAVGIVNERFDNILEGVIQENITETQEFIDVGREIICDLLESQSDYDNETFEDMVNFVVHEASNYQILSMLIDGELPDEEYSDQASVLVEGLNNFAGTNFILLETKGEEIKKVLKQTLDKRAKVIAGYKKNIAGYEARGPVGKALAMRERKRMNDYMKTVDKQIEGLKNRYAKVAPTERLIRKGREVAGKAKEVGKAAVKGISKFAQTPAGMAVGGLAAAALVGYAAYKIYKNFIAKAARACKGAPDKTACMKEYRNKGIQAQIASLKSGVGKCANSKDPEKCKAAIQTKISKLQGKVKAQSNVG